MRKNVNAGTLTDSRFKLGSGIIRPEYSMLLVKGFNDQIEIEISNDHGIFRLPVLGQSCRPFFNFLMRYHWLLPFYRGAATYNEKEFFSLAYRKARATNRVFIEVSYHRYYTRQNILLARKSEKEAIESFFFLAPYLLPHIVSIP